jgi:hypothetical protein
VLNDELINYSVTRGLFQTLDYMYMVGTGLRPPVMLCVAFEVLFAPRMSSEARVHDAGIVSGEYKSTIGLRHLSCFCVGNEPAFSNAEVDRRHHAAQRA